MYDALMTGPTPADYGKKALAADRDDFIRDNVCDDQHESGSHFLNQDTIQKKNQRS